MDILQAAILGVIEGITEFLPVSSTGHLIIASQILGVEPTEKNKAFEVIIQIAAILAIVSYYKDKFSTKHIQLWIKIFIAFIPIGIIGLLFHSQIKELFTVTTVAWLFIIGGVIFLIMEYLYNEGTHRTNNIDDFSLKQSFWIGIAQTLALIPGTSRAGASVIGAIAVGLNRKTAAEFSFLLAMPVLFFASGFDLVRHYKEFVNSGWEPLLIGFFVAFIVAFFSMKIFILFLEKFTFRFFGFYRIIFGLVLLIYFA